jgi:hypothetical protein
VYFLKVNYSRDSNFLYLVIFAIMILTMCCILQVPTGSHAHPANIGELFSEGSLNPYADDPYAFD